MVSEYEKMIAGDFFIDLRTLNYGLWQKSLGRNKKLLTRDLILKGAAIIKSGLDQPVKTSISIVRFLWIMGSTSI